MKRKFKLTSFLEKGPEFVGKLKSKGSLRIDCHFRGDISVEGTLIVGKNALIQADIHVSSAIIYGEIRGNVFVDQRIDIFASGKIFGDIQSSIMMMDEGAIIEGRIQLNQRKTENESILDVSVSGENSDIANQSLGMIHGIVMGGSPQINGNINGVSALEEDG